MVFFKCWWWNILSFFHKNTYYYYFFCLSKLIYLLSSILHISRWRTKRHRCLRTWRRLHPVAPGALRSWAKREVRKLHASTQQTHTHTQHTTHHTHNIRAHAHTLLGSPVKAGGKENYTQAHNTQSSHTEHTPHTHFWALRSRARLVSIMHAT